MISKSQKKKKTYFFRVTKRLYSACHKSFFCVLKREKGKLITVCLFVGLHMSMGFSFSTNAPITITFQSKEQLQSLLAPHSIEELLSRTALTEHIPPLTFNYDVSMREKHLLEIRNQKDSNFIENIVFRAKTLCVCYPATPRVPHHITLVLHRRNVKGLTDITEEENAEIFATIRKITEIYKTIAIDGFVIGHYDVPQQGHGDRYVVEIIPHLPSFNSIKNIVDKIDCNRHVLFRRDNLSSIICEISKKTIKDHVRFWQEAFTKEQTAIMEEDIDIAFPYQRLQSHQLEAERILYQHLIELLQDKGGQCHVPLLHTHSMPMEIPGEVHTVSVAKCFFCDDVVIKRQLVYEYENVRVFYNIRNMAKKECAFLILPKRHIEKVYKLSQEEINTMRIVRQALVEVLREVHPDHEVVVYTQDSSSVGQTVFHSHEQVVSIDPKTVALSWTLMSLHPNISLSDEEMQKGCEKFSLLLESKLQRK